jgi:predicted MFS family arabinose efflux permease
MDDHDHRFVREEQPSDLATDRQRSLRGLDWFVFFVADVQTGFGPFIAVYLTAHRWTQTDIGFVLTVGGLISLFGQIPAGALLDTLRSLRRAAAISVCLVGLSALIFAFWPTHLGVYTSRALQAGASCILGPVIAAISLGIVRPHAVGQRFGRNAAFASAGTGIAAAVMGLCGYYISNQSVFIVTALLALPALAALMQIDESDINTRRAHGGDRQSLSNLAEVIRFASTHRPIFIFASCVFLFHLANAGVLPLVANSFTVRSSTTATFLIALAMILPQFTVAVISPAIGRMTGRYGRRIFLLLGFSALFVRILLTAISSSQATIVALQALDGISAAVLGVLVPLTIADLTRQTGRFNLIQGVIGCAMGLGASLSTTLAGLLADRFNTMDALISLSAIAALGFLLVWVAMPETKGNQDDT